MEENEETIFSKWDKVVEDYAESIKGKILTEEEVRTDLDSLFSRPYGMIPNLARGGLIRQHAKRLANFNPQVVESVEDFEDLAEVENADIR